MTKTKKKSLKYFRLPEVLQIVGLSKQSLYRLMKIGKFPMARQLGERAVGWRESDIRDWTENRPLVKLIRRSI